MTCQHNQTCSNIRFCQSCNRQVGVYLQMIVLPRLCLSGFVYLCYHGGIHVIDSDHDKTSLLQLRMDSQTQVAQQQFLWSPGEAVWEGGEWLRLIVPALRWRSFFLKNRTSVILQMQIYLLMRSFGFWQYNLISGTQMTSICTTTWQGIFSQNIISSKLTSDISSLAWKGLSLERRLGSPKFFLTITILTIASRSKFVNKSFHCFIKESAMSSIFWLPACSTSCWLSWVQSCWRTIPSWDSVP